MEVKIGIRDVGREVVLESRAHPRRRRRGRRRRRQRQQSLLRLTDDKGRLIIVPGPLIGYVEIGAEETRRVGFGTL